MRPIHRMFSILASVAAVLAVAGAGTLGLAAQAQAAPQVVAALPTAGAVPLSCRDGHCWAELSTICLQRDRATPGRFQTYRISDGHRDAVAVVGHRADGGTVALPAGVLRLDALRGPLAFRASVSETWMKAQGIERMTLALSRPALLAPEPEPGDPRPQAAADLARAEATFAAVAGGWQERNAETLAMARVAGRIINRLPGEGTVPAAEADALFDQATAGESALSAEARGWTRRAVDYCRDSADGAGGRDMRRCLGGFHDRTLHDINVGYWKAAKPQS